MPFDPNAPSELVAQGQAGFDPDAPSEVVAVEDLPSMRNPPVFGSELRAPRQDEIAQQQRRQIREVLSPILGDSPEQAAARIEGLPQRGLLAPRPSIPIPRMGPAETTAGKIGAGLVNAGAGMVEGLEQPLLLMSGASLPGAVNSAVSAYFAGDMASHVPEGVRQTIEAARQGDLQRAVESGAGTLGSAAFAIGAGRHAIEAAPIPDAPAAVVARQLERETLDARPSQLPSARSMVAASVAPIEAQGIVEDAGVYQAREDAPWLAQAAAQARGEPVDLTTEPTPPNTAESRTLPPDTAATPANESAREPQAQTALEPIPKGGENRGQEEGRQERLLNAPAEPAAAVETPAPKPEPKPQEDQPPQAETPAVAESKPAERPAPEPAPPVEPSPVGSEMPRGFYKEASGKMVIVMPKAEYDGLHSSLRDRIRKYFNWSPTRQAFISKASKDLFWPMNIAREARLEEVSARSRPEPTPKAKRNPTAVEPDPTATSEKPSAVEQPRFNPDAPSEPVATRPEEVDQLPWTRFEIDPNELRANKDKVAAVDATKKELEIQLQEARTYIRQLEDKVLLKTGRNKGAIKTTAKSVDVSAYRSWLASANQLEMAIRTIDQQTSGARQVLETHRMMQIAEDPNATPLSRLGARVAVSVGVTGQVPDPLLAALNAAAAQEVMRRAPDAHPSEISNAASAIASAAVEGRDIAGYQLALDFQKQRREKLVKAMIDAGSRLQDVSQLDPELKAILDEKVPAWWWSASPDAGKSPVSFSDLTELPARLRKAIEGKAAKEAEIRAQEQAKAQAAAELEAREMEKARQMMADAAEEMAKTGTKRGAREIKEELLRRIDEAIPNAAENEVDLRESGKPLNVIIAVPGDGVFRLANLKSTLQALRDRAKTLQTASVQPSGQSTARGATIPKLNAGGLDAKDILKNLNDFTEQEGLKGKEDLAEVFSDGQRAIASDGRIAIEVQGQFPKRDSAQHPFPIKKFGALAQSIDALKGDWIQVSSEELIRAARIAKRMDWKESIAKVQLYASEDGSIYAETTDKSGDFASYGTPTQHRYLGSFPAEQLERFAEFARKMGDEQLRVRRTNFEDSKSFAMTVKGSKWRGFVMPLTDLARETEFDTSKPGKIRRSKSAEGYQASAYPGGPLGTGPVDPTANPEFSAFPVELPEAVEFARQLLGGKYPKVVEQIRKIRNALGVFAHNDATGEASIELRADTALLLRAEDRIRLRKEAAEYAKAVGGSRSETMRIARERYKYLLDQALEEAKRRNPEVAMKVMWHEIGHLVDWLPDHMIRGRGNLFGHIAALKDYLRHSLPLDSKTPDRPITDADRAKLYREAEALVREALGPIEEIVRTIIVEEPIFASLKLTPEDVKGLLGMDARERMPELYEWFARQDTATKRDILRAAMKGTVDARLEGIGGKEQVGTRKVERTVREKVGREPTREEIKAKFNELIEAEIKRRRMAQLARVKAELEPLIAWWRGTPTMEPYFSTGAEMYAEAFSVFMNNPAAMAAKAPTAYALFHGWMDARPAVKELYDRVQDQIASGAVMRDRVGRLRDSWRKDAEASVKKLQERATTKARDFYDNVLYHFDRRFGPVFRAVKGTASEAKVREAVGNYTYRAVEHERFLAHMNERIGGRLLRENLDWHWLGEYLFHQRVAQERHSMYNPLGWTSKNSLERMQEMRAQLGPTRYAALEGAAQEFRKVYAEQVIPLMQQARLWNEKLQAKIDENVAYATFSAVRGLADNGIQREIELSFGPTITPHIYRQVGMLGEIKNPATATVLKALSLISAAHRNIAKREIVAALQREAPADITPAKRQWTGQRWEHRIEDTDRVGTIVLLNDGKVEAYVVRKDIANAINFAPAMQSRLQGAIIGVLNWQKGLFTALNYGFWPWNFVRDTVDWWAKMPGTLPQTMVGWTKNLPRAFEAGSASAHGRIENKIADDLLRRRMVVSREDPRGVMSGAENEFDVKLASFGLDPKLWDAEASGVHSLVKLWHKYLSVGQTLERAQKASGMLYLDEKFPQMPEWKKVETVREMAGSPDFLQRGASNPAIDFFMLFYNPWKQGMRAWVKSAKERPWQFAGKTATMVALPSALMAAANAGAFGDDTREKYRSIPDYDLTNYFVIPLGWVDKEHSKVAYFRLPLPDPMRIMHGSIFKGLTGRGDAFGQMFGGQLPGLNPLFQTAMAWGDYLAGRNPVDMHTGRHVVDETTFAAGGWPAAAEMGKHTWNTLGGSILHRFQNVRLDAPPNTPLENFLNAPGVANAIGRWVRISNRGRFDEDQRASKEIEQHRAQVRLAVQELATRWAEAGLLDGLMEANQQRDIGAMRRQIAETELSKSERVLLREPYAQEHLQRILPDMIRSRQSLQAQRLQRMPSKASKADLIRRDRNP